MGKKLKKLKKSKLSGLKKASTKKKILIGGGVAAVAVAAGAGGLYLAKRYKRGQQGKLLDGSSGSRDISSINQGATHPSLEPFLRLQDNKEYLTNNYTIGPLPTAVTVGLGWDSEHGNVNLDLLASVFDYSGNSIGYVQGSTVKEIFNKGVTHSGDDVQGSNPSSSENTLSTVLGDNEHVTIDFSQIPQHAASIVVGVLLVDNTKPILNNCYVNVLPLIRADTVSNAVSVEYDSDEGESSPAPSHGERGLGGASYADEDDELFLLFKAKLEQQHPDFVNSRGFVAVKIERVPGSNNWQLVPIRAVVPIDLSYGLWPALQHYAKLPSQPQQQQYQQQQYQQYNQGYNQGYYPPQY